MENNNNNINDNINDSFKKGSVTSSQNVGMYSDAAFGNNVFYKFAKQSERAATAIHMVSNFISKDNVLRNEMRKYSLRMVKNLYKCITCDSYDQQFFLEEAMVNIEYIITTMSVASATGVISEMNKSVLEKALHRLGTHIHRQLQIALRYEENFSSNIAPSIDKDTLLEFLQETDAADRISDDDFQQVLQEAISNKRTFKPTVNDINTKRHLNRQDAKKPTHDTAGDRREVIRSIIAQKGEVTIKDIATRITNCSEKTLQRDLVRLIKDNVIEKEGEKRWSVYRIKDIKDK